LAAAEGIVLTVVIVAVARTRRGALAIQDLPFANMIDTRPVDGALSGPQIGAFPDLRGAHGPDAPCRSVRYPMTVSTSPPNSPTGGRTEFQVSQGTGGVAVDRWRFGSGVLGVLWTLLPRNVGMARRHAGHMWRGSSC
jgi:hypothetical protein